MNKLNVDIFSIRDASQEIINDYIHKIQIKKESLIKEKLLELGLIHLLDDVKKKRFKPLVCEIHPTEEVWYADNNTLEGIRVITFKKLNTENFNVNLEYF